VKSGEILLHPVRMRIWQAFLGDRPLTVSELRAELPDIPSASLYRQVGVLAENDVLAVAGERQVGGATERTYVLRAAAATITDRELAAMDADEHRQAFAAFVAGLAGDFDRYLEGGDVDLRRDGVGYRILGMWLDEKEFAELATELSAVLQPRLALGPREGRTRRLLATVMLPGRDREPG
jgi:Helix-turn-helix domain